jgi:hypothetical protein
VLFEADGTTPFDATIGQYDIPGETFRLAYEPDTTGTYYLALLPDVDYPLLGEYTITFETPATGELELTVYDMFNELGAIDCYLMVTEVGGDPATDTIAEAVTAPNTAVTVTIPSTTTAWTGSGAYDVHVVLDMDSSGDSTPTDGDYVGINPVVVSGDTHAELLLDYLEPYFEPDSYEPDDSAATATAIAINGAAQTHNLSDGADLDYVSFVADGSSSYTVNTTSSGYMTFDLLDSGEMLLESHYLYGGPSSDSLGMLIAGTYYLEFYNGPQAYTVEVTSP